MKRLNELYNVRITSKKPNNLFKVVIKDVVDNFMDNNDLNPKLHLTFKKPRKGTFGDIQLSKETIVDNKIKMNIDINASLRYMVSSLYHELTHVKQVMRGRLGVNGKFITWDGVDYISISEYRRITINADYDTYKELPWEKEALSEQKTLTDEYFLNIKSISYGKDATLDYLIDNDLI